MQARFPRLAERTRHLAPGKRAARRGHPPARLTRTEEHRLAITSAAEEAPDAGDPGRPSPTASSPAPIDTPERLARASGGPQDHALYQCSCGYVFDANVSTSVHCPHCGHTQAW
jgi:hypothetical protein